MDRHVVTSFLEHDGRFLVLKRSNAVSTYKGKWSGVSGSVLEGEPILDAAKREVYEETGIEPKDLTLIASSNTLTIPFTGFDWVVHPVLFHTVKYRIVLNWENEDYKWVARGDMGDLDTVPGLLDALEGLLKVG